MLLAGCWVPATSLESILILVFVVDALMHHAKRLHFGAGLVRDCLVSVFRPKLVKDAISGEVVLLVLKDGWQVGVLVNGGGSLLRR